MIIKTFGAKVERGRLEHEESLNELEGRRVQVTVAEEQSATPPYSVEYPEPEDEPEPPEWLDIEKDIYVPMRGKVEVLKDVTIVDKGRARPTIILPEDLPND